MEHTKEDLRDLMGGRLSWEKVKSIMSQPKDDDRFEKYVEILQEQVPWPERILMPLGEHIHVVQKGDERVVKCDCGHEFGDWRVNWKLHAHVLVRDDAETLEEIYPGYKRPDPDLCEIREFYCPGCAALLKVDSVPVGYPILFDILPDIDAFYRDWLDRPLPDGEELKDLSGEVTRAWGEE